MSYTQISSAEHRIISPDDARFKSLDDFNQEFSKAMLPSYSRYGEQDNLSLLLSNHYIEELCSLLETGEYPMDEGTPEAHRL